MKALWIVSFRPIGSSKSNDLFQNIFIESIKSLDFDVTLSATQFDDLNVKELSGVAIMTDTDNSKLKAISYYQNIYFSSE